MNISNATRLPTDSTKRDIENEADIQKLVYCFYDFVRADELIGPVFKSVIPDDHWPAHLEKLCAFWSSMLLFTNHYAGEPMAKHTPLPLEGAHFAQWLKLFRQALVTHFSGETAQLAWSRAATIARVMQATKGIPIPTELM
jgi:hemoglobin